MTKKDFKKLSNKELVNYLIHIVSCFSIDEGMYTVNHIKEVKKEIYERLL